MKTKEVHRGKQNHRSKQGKTVTPHIAFHALKQHASNIL